MRIFPVLRAHGVQDLDAVAPRQILYFEASFDMDGVAIPDHVRRASLGEFWRALRDPALTTAEVWEPLWIRELPRWCLTVAGLRLLGRQRAVVLYAIENNDLERILAKDRAVPAWLLRLFERSLRAFASRTVDRVAYGSRGAALTYDGVFDPRRVDTVLVEELPSAARPSAAQERSPLEALSDDLPSAVFLGPLEDRKGVLELIEAWPEVEDAVSGCCLTIVGDGPLAPNVERWASERPDSRRWTGFVPRSQALRHLDKARVLVAPSVPVGRWREQLGSPIQEALARGRTIVTTSQTGLAQTLQGGGHVVLEPGSLEADLGAGLISALQEPLRPGDVVAGLPAEHGRVVADRWLHRPVA